MPLAIRNVFERDIPPITATRVDPDSPRRAGTEAFIRRIFARRYGADIADFAPNLWLLEQGHRAIAAAGWRPAGEGPLFLERYLDVPIEQALVRPAWQSVCREDIVEVGHLAAEKAGGSLRMIVTMSEALHRMGYAWVVFTATRELVGIFHRLGLPLLAIAQADPSRLGDAAKNWGSYYATHPIIVGGRIQLGLDRARRRA
mgnify:CR=1 FL=1|jgi:hypothetical protein